jgi:hypothetical protein
MQRKRKIVLIIILGIVVIVGGFGGYALYRLNPAHWTSDSVQISFPLADTQYINAIQGYGEMTWGDFHNGIDIGVNHSTELIAWCDMRIIALKTWYNEKGGHWQTNIAGAYSWKYKFDVAVESWALNETYGNLQREALIIKVGQTVERGESLGFLLWHGSGTHIHFGLKESGDNVCPYQFMIPSAKSTIDYFFALYGSGGTICGT